MCMRMGKSKAFSAAISFFVFLLFPLLVIAADSALAQDDYEDLDLCSPPSQQYYNDKNRGWYHHEFCQKRKEEAEKEHKRKTAKQQPQKEKPLDWAKMQDPKYLDTLSASQFRDLLKKAQEEAIYKPDKDKVFAVIKMQDYMKNKSMEFAYLWRDQLLQNPEIDPSTKFPTTSFASYTHSSVVNADKRKMLSEMMADTGLFFFVSGDCPYCHSEADIINYIKSDYGIAINTISNDHCNSDKFKNCSVDADLFKYFDIKMTPSIVAVYKDSDNKPHFQPIASGLTTMDEITNRLVFYYKFTKTGEYPGLNK